MRVAETRLPGVLIVEPAVAEDPRGFFYESYHRLRYVEYGIADEFVQDNHSRSTGGVLRGIHYQDLSAPMAKLVRCTFGIILDVAVDLRRSSATFGQWVGIEISEQNRRQVLIPVGFGHAFLALSEVAELQYKCSGFYTPTAEGTIAWDDPDLAIDWPIRDPILSVKDTRGISLAEYARNPAFP